VSPPPNKALQLTSNSAFQLGFGSLLASTAGARAASEALLAAAERLIRWADHATTMVQLREFRPDDAAACCSVINAAVRTMSGLSDAAQRLVTSKNTPVAFAQDVATAHCLVAVDDARVVGVGAIDGAEIKRLYVLPECHKRGVGTAILLELEAHARRVGLSELFLQASPSSQRFYAARSYRVTREEVTVSGPAQFTHVRMEKAFDSSPR
jgi:GNAT superfamily N-acetyltransferase